MGNRVQPALDNIGGLVRTAVQQYRSRLLDLSSRNPLISFRHSERSRTHVRVIDEIPEVLFSKLEAGNQLLMAPLPDPPEGPDDEDSTPFQHALKLAKREDAEYRERIVEIGPHPSERKRKKIERELRNRVRQQLGMEPFEKGLSPQDVARSHGIDPSYELPLSPNDSAPGQRRHNDRKVQTLLFRDDLDRKLSAISDSARVLLQDAGLSTLYCAFGFLEYYERDDADEKRVAPLVFFPIEIDRQLVEGEYQYWIKPRNDDVEVNVALAELLRTELGIELPSWTETEDGRALAAYFERIALAIRARVDWKLRRCLTIGLFTFSTLVMYKDLDPSRWQADSSLEGHPLLRTLVAGAEVHDLTFASDYDVDQLPAPDVLLITDADTSQHSAIVDVLNGKNSVIQGPPGTGKSQTITNIISAALHAGKSVLFVAEKMAALEVVKKRLDAAKLDQFCLEVHSSKTARAKVIGSLSERLEYRGPGVPTSQIRDNVEALQRDRKALLEYVQRVNEPAGQTGLLVRNLLLGNACRDELRTHLPATIISARFSNALSLSQQMRVEMSAAADNLEAHTEPLRSCGGVREHPWRGLENAELTDLEIERLRSALQATKVRIADLKGCIRDVGATLGADLPLTLGPLLQACDHLTRLPLPASDIDARLFVSLGSQDQRMKLRSAAKAVATLLTTERRLGDYSSDIAALLALGRKSLQAISDDLSKVKVVDGTVDDLEQKEAEDVSGLSALDAVERITLRALGLSASKIPLDAVRAAQVGIEAAQSLTPYLLTFRQPTILDPANAEMLCSATRRRDKLVATRTSLDRQLDLRLLPSADQLRRSAISLRAANAFSQFFKSDCRRGRAIYRAARKEPHKTSRSELATLLLECSDHLTAHAHFVNDPALRSAFGVAFRGIETDFGAAVQVNEWASKVRHALAPWGEMGMAMRDRLFAGDADVLAGLVASSQDRGFSAFNEVPLRDIASVTVDDLRATIQRRLDALRRARDSFARAHLSGGVALTDLSVLTSLLAEHENTVASLASEPAILDSIGGNVAAAKQRIASVTATLRHAEGLAAAAGATLVHDYLFADISNTSIVHSQANRLLDEAHSTIKAMQAFIDIAKLDLSVWCAAATLGDANIAQFLERCERADSAMDTLQDYVNFLLAEDEACDLGLGPILQAFTEVSEDYHHLRQASEFVFYRSAAEQVLELHPSLRRHSGSSHEHLRQQYQELDRQHLKLRRRQLASELTEKEVPWGVTSGRVGELTELGLVQKLAGQTRPRVTLRDLFRRAGKAIQTLKPCWMMSPMSVAQFLEPGKLQFDILIMDEASQIRPQEALGGIARCKQLVVVGDQMQLPPSPFFQKLSSDSGTSEDDEDVDVHQESILEAAASRFFPARRLNWHYRSEHGSLISFSNQEFYRNSLTVFPSPHHDHPEYGVKLISVAGKYEAGINREEAAAIVEAATEFMANHSKQSLGIVAVNSKQAELIREEMDRLFARDENAEAYRAKWSEDLEYLFVKNLENVQGDERDAIFISTVYGKDPQGNFYQRFGPINSVDGHRRLNVLFTRAKKKVTVFSSMVPEEIADAANSGVQVLRGYLQFARDGRWTDIQAIGGECESEFEQWVLDVLRSKGYVAVPQLGFAGYRIDIAVRHPARPGTFMCGIECDGATYHSARSIRERDRLRQEILEHLGWNIYRIWSTDWFRNPSLQTKNLLRHMDTLART